MSTSEILLVFLAIVPTIVVGVIAYFFFKSYVNDQENTRRYKLKKETGKELLAYRIQALERMTLFLERIDPGRLLLRVKPVSDDKYGYEALLISTIEQEFDHNLAQQIYVSPACWNAIRTTKNATIALIRKTNMQEKVDSPEKLREVLLSELAEGFSPSATGLEYLKKEARDMWTY